MSGRCDVIVIGGSAGAIEALLQIIAALPAGLSALIFVAVHVRRTAVSVLPRILAREGRLPALHPTDGERTERGVIYVAPPDFNLLVQDGAVRVSRDANVDGLRPAIDPLFESAAATYGRRVLGVVLSGNLDDGAEGASVIAAAGGAIVVQDPDDSPYPSMPRETLARVPSAVTLPVDQIAAFIVRQLEVTPSTSRAGADPA